MKRNHLPFDRRQRFGFRKLSMGLASCFLGSVFLLGATPTVLAESTATAESSTTSQQQGGSILLAPCTADGQKIGLATLVDSTHPALPSTYKVEIAPELPHDSLPNKKWVFTGQFVDEHRDTGNRRAETITIKPIYELRDKVVEEDLPVNLAEVPIELRVVAGHTVTMVEIQDALNKREQGAGTTKNYDRVELTNPATVLTYADSHSASFTVKASYSDYTLHGGSHDTITVNVQWVKENVTPNPPSENPPSGSGSETGAPSDIDPSEDPVFKEKLEAFFESAKDFNPENYTPETSTNFVNKIKTLVGFIKDKAPLANLETALNEAIKAHKELVPKKKEDTPNPTGDDSKPSEGTPTPEVVENLEQEMAAFFKELGKVDVDAYTEEELRPLGQAYSALMRAVQAKEPSLAAIQDALAKAKKAYEDLLRIKEFPTPTPAPPVAKPEIAMNKDLVLHYLKPAATTYAGWERESLPIGNGDIGSKVFGLVGREKIQFNEKTLWSGGPKEGQPYNGGNNKGKHSFLPEIRRALEEGNIKKAKELAQGHLVGPNNAQYGRYLAFGDVNVDFFNDSKDVKEVSDYGRYLDLKTAIASTDYTYKNNKYHRESFVSYPDNVSVTHFTKTGTDKLDLNITLTPTMDLVAGGFGAYDTTKKSEFKESTVTYTTEGALLKGYVKDNGLQFASFLKVDTDGKVSVVNDKLQVTGATYVTLYLSAETDFAQDPKNGYRDKTINVENFVKETANKASRKGYDAVKTAHISDYQALFNRVKLTLTPEKSHKPTDVLLKEYRKETGQELEELFFQYGRYLMITSSRDGKNALPANLQGVWNAVDNPPWNADYHLNVNLQMNYWPVYSSNMAETALPLINYIDDMRHYGRIAAAEYANIVSKEGEENGWLVHTQATPFGWTTPGWDYYWGWSPASNAWIMQNVYDYYRFTKDEKFLKEKIYPMLKETAKFWNKFLHYDQKSDRFVSSPSYSPEHGTITIGNTYDQSLVWQLFHDFIEAANVLKVDKDLVDEITVKYDKLKPLHINAKGQIKEWFEEDTPGFTNEGIQKGHRHVSHLVGLFPGTLFSKDNLKYLEAAKASLNDRGDGGTGWSKANKINLWARLLDGNRAHRLLAEQLNHSTLTNLWDTHTPFQIDGNFGATSGIAEMLLQSHSGYIAPLAALPDAWKTGEVSGLMARGNVEVDMAWTNKNLTTLKLQAKKGGAIQIDYPNIETATLLINGKPATFRKVQNDRIEIDSKAGDVITLNQITGRIADLTATRQSATKALVSFTGLPQAEYYVINRSELDDSGKVVATQIFKTAETNFLDTTINESRAYMYQAQPITASGSLSVSNTAIITPLLDLFDDRDTRIQYGSAYADYADGSLYNSSEKYIDITDKRDKVSDEAITATIPFVGSGIEVYGLKSNQLGKALVTIDGKPVEGLDFYKASSTADKGVLIGRYDGLTEGPHVMTIRVSREVPTRRERNKISLDFFKVLHEKSNTEKLDDRDTRIQYGKEFKPYGDKILYAGTETYADLADRTVAAADATASLTFEGTGIQIYGIKSNQLGKAKVMLDGKPMPDLNFFKEGATEKGVLIGEYTGLTDGRHTVTIQVDLEAQKQGRRKISLDYFVIQKSEEKPLIPAEATDVTMGDAEVAIQLPTTDWTKIEVRLPEVATPITINKSEDKITAVGATIRTVDNKVYVTLPANIKPGLIQLKTFHQAEVAPMTVALIKENKKIKDDVPPTAPVVKDEVPSTAPVAEDKPMAEFDMVPPVAPTAEDKPIAEFDMVPPVAPTAEDKPIAEFDMVPPTAPMVEELPIYKVGDDTVETMSGSGTMLGSGIMVSEKPKVMGATGASVLANGKSTDKSAEQQIKSAAAGENKLKEGKKLLPVTGETGSVFGILGLAIGVLLVQEVKRRKEGTD